MRRNEGERETLKSSERDLKNKNIYIYIYKPKNKSLRCLAGLLSSVYVYARVYCIVEAYTA